jgi:hypothetical protein
VKIVCLTVSNGFGKEVLIQLIRKLNTGRFSPLDVCFCLAVLFSIAVRFAYTSYPVVGFSKSQTAITAQFYVNEGLSIKPRASLMLNSPYTDQREYANEEL